MNASRTSDVRTGAPASLPSPEGATALRYARILAGFVLVTCTGVVVAWATDLRALTEPTSSLPPMKANTAVALVLLSGSIVVRLRSSRWRWTTSRILAGAAAALALASISQDAFGWNLGFDELIAPDRSGVPGSPGRMAVTTGLCVLLLGVALALNDRTRLGRRLAHANALIGVVASVTAIGGYLYGVDEVVAPIGATRVALQTSVSLLALSVAVLLVRSDAGVVRWLLRPTPGAYIARRLILVLSAGPLLVGWIFLRGADAGAFGNPTGMFLFAAVSTLTALGLLAWVVRLVDRMDRVQRDVEGAVRRSEAHYRSLLRNSVEITAETGLDTTVRYISPSVERIMGYTPAELRGRPVAELIHPEDLVSTIEAIRRGLASPGEPQTLEVRVLNASGAWRVLEIAGQVVADGLGDPSTMVLNARDVTERYAVQKRLEDSRRELERSNEELEQFAYVASHDLQEPLRMVASHLQLLAEDLGGTLDEEQAESLNFAVDGATRMQLMIRDLLTYSRVDSRGRPFEPTAMDDALATALHGLQLAIADAGATVTSEPLPVVNADPGQMTQLLQNLVANAIKFRGSEPPAVHIGAAPEGGAWRFSVLDNGIGIAPEHAERVFQIFQRLHTRREYEGTGIGLAVCRRIVERHGGQIWIESEPGRGCEIRFTIPSTAATAAA